MDKDLAATWPQLAHTVVDTDEGQAAFTLLSTIRATGEPTSKLALLGYIVMVDASVHTQLEVLASAKLRMETHGKVPENPALFVAELNVNTTELPTSSNTAEIS